MEIITDINISVNKAIHFVNEATNLLEYNSDSISNIKGLGFVYFIYLINTKNKRTRLVYIGKSKGYLFKTRLRNHFYKKHSKTGSKLSLVKFEKAQGNEVKLKFIKIKPESFRNTLEEELINHFQPIWNIQRGNK